MVVGKLVILVNLILFSWWLIRFVIIELVVELVVLIVWLNNFFKVIGIWVVVVWVFFVLCGLVRSICVILGKMYSCVMIW